MNCKLYMNLLYMNVLIFLISIITIYIYIKFFFKYFIYLFYILQTRNTLYRGKIRPVSIGDLHSRLTRLHDGQFLNY